MAAMPDLTALLVLTLIVVVGAGFWRGQAVRERALRLTRRHCAERHVLLLDQTVAFAGWRLRRDRQGWPRLERSFRFEFTVTGTERYRGRTITAGEQVLAIALEPHRLPDDSPETTGSRTGH